MYYVHSLGIGTFFALCTAESCKKSCLYWHLFITYLLKLTLIIKYDYIEFETTIMQINWNQIDAKNYLRLTKKAENKDKEL